jgi:outer membrane lipoprotein-sorting protein
MGYTKNKIFLVLLFVVILICTSFDFASVDRIAMRMGSQSLNRGKVVRVEADLYFQSLNGRLVTNYLVPFGQVMISNNKGELAIYNTESNSVSYRQGAEYSTESNLIHFFLQGKTQDLGLNDFGFLLTSTEFKDGLVITEWFPPASLYHLFNRIELVHQDFLPVYVAYYDAQRKLAKKVYYSGYQHLSDISLPTLITEFNYIGNDSIINRIRFSDIRINHNAQSSWFNFEIPADAKTSR